MKRIYTALLVSGCLAGCAAFAADDDTAMRDHMQHMQDTMTMMQSEQDPARRAELRREHHAMMQRGMEMMKQQDTSDLSMEERMGRMEERMETMRMMMSHMMEAHAPQDAAETPPEHEH
jgi:hypothetical protein